MYDLIIIGAGPAGLSAAIYAANYKLKTLVLAEIIGGTAIDAHKVSNYPGFKSIVGIELMNKMMEQAQAAGIEIKEVTVVGIKQDKHFIITDKQNKKYESKALTLAMGTKKRELGVPGEKEFLGRGVSYCATCDAPMFKDKLVAIVGGSNAAAQSALLLAEYARTVYIIYRKAELRAKPATISLIKKNKKIEVLYNTNIKEIKGEKFVESVMLDNGEELKVQGVFVEIGGVPSIEIAKNLGVKFDEENCIIVEAAQQTNIEGVFAAGDITTGSNKLRQIVTAVSEGAIAAISAYKFIKNAKHF